MKAPLLTVDLDEIPPEGLTLPLDLSPGQVLELVSPEDQPPPEVLTNLAGTLKVQKLDGRLKLDGSFEVGVTLACDRCLAEGPVRLTGDIDEILSLSPSESTGGNGEDESDGLLTVKGGQVDLTGLVAEWFWLAWPFRYICRDDCAGLCPRCGADLNQGPCPCRTSQWN